MGSNHAGHNWPQEHQDTLRMLWNGNEHHASEIRDIINRTFDCSLSSSAIIGKAHRMGLMHKENVINRHKVIDRYEFIRLYNTGLSYREMAAAFGLNDDDQVKYRVKKFGLTPRLNQRTRKPRESVMIGTPRGADPRGLKREDMGLPRQTYDMINHGSKKWFQETQRCVAQPCLHYAVPTGRVCFTHGGMM